MKQSTFKMIEIILNDFPYYDKYIHQRELELMYPYQQTDENIGGGKSNIVSSPDEFKAIRLAEDPVIKRYEEWQQVVTEVLKSVDNDSYKIIKMYYFDKPRTKTWNGIAKEVNYSRRQCFNIRTAIFEKIADKLGLVK